MSGPKRKMLFGIWISVALALALLLASAVGAGATPPLPPERDSGEDYAANREPALKYPLPGGAAPRSKFSLPDATPPEGAAPDGIMAPSQTTATCPIGTNFDTMPAGWVSYSGTWYTELGNLFTTGFLGTATIASPGSYDNFSFEARMQRAGCDNCANGLIVRGTPLPLSSSYDWDSWYIFIYFRNGHYMVVKRVAGVDTLLTPSDSSPAINQGAGWNTVRVEVNKSRLKYYINNFELWSGTDTSLGSGKAGILMWKDLSSSGDRLWVDYARFCVSGHLSYLPGVLQP